ncbi:hypothetical protein NQ315_000713 [Exocentrus adspersus]|uniref:Active regulator of SIRT1 n=1 Tax=Exocentrus adspersus TaxID=1586481 RepID=A0AAV8WD81_9CUCU|nr:hypothetical protein NQ315_000713 [Exocentrus adspersus]
MSASLVRKGLEIVESAHDTGYKRNKRKKEVFQLVPENQKVIAKNRQKGGKVETVNLLSHKNKVNVTDIRKKIKTKDQILKDNLKKLKLIKKASRISLDKDIIHQIIERAVTRRPVTKKKQQEKDKKTVFTEEDFKKFEEEYFDE